MAKKNQTVLEEAVVAQPHENMTNVVEDGNGVITRTVPRPAFQDAADQAASQVADSSVQGARLPQDVRQKAAESAADARRLGVSAGMTRAKRAMFPGQEDRLRAVPAALSSEGGMIGVAESTFQPSALVEFPDDEGTRFDVGDQGEALLVQEPTPQEIVAAEPMEEAIQTGESMVVVTPTANFDCTIGHHRWYFKKDQKVKVPQSVKEVLARGMMIYPG